MTPPTSDIAFTPAVKALQEQNGSRAGYARMAEKKDWHAAIAARRVYLKAPIFRSYDL